MTSKTTTNYFAIIILVVSEGVNSRQSGVVRLPLLRMQYEHNRCQYLVHALSVAQFRLLLAVDKQNIQHGIPSCIKTDGNITTHRRKKQKQQQKTNKQTFP